MQKKMSGLQRLNFQRDVVKPGTDYLNTGVCTHAMQGKIFYKKGDLVYTQGRDDLPEKMKIRGKELEKDTYLHFFDMIEPEKMSFEKETVVVFMVSRQDLLITHRHIFGTQVFLLGFLSEDGFTPACQTVEKMSEYYKEKDIQIASSYEEDGKMYIPAKVENIQEILEKDGSFVHTFQGSPITIFSEKKDKIFNLFSDTQNNLQLFVKVFFISKKPNIVEDLHKTLEEITPFTPQDKTAEFVVYIEKFKELLEFFKGRSVCYSLTTGRKNIRLVYEEEEEKWMQKAEKSLKTLVSNMTRILAENKINGNHIKISLHKQVSDALFSFFRYEMNINNCCHIVKHLEKIKYQSS